MIHMVTQYFSKNPEEKGPPTGENACLSVALVELSPEEEDMVSGGAIKTIYKPVGEYDSDAQVCREI
jgi:hypothetical protein